MRRILPLLLLGLLSFTTWKVFDVRSRLGAQDYDVEKKSELQASLAALPHRLADGQYIGEPYEISEEVIRLAGADVYGSIEYFDHEDRNYRVYLGGAIGNQENFHAPSYCLPAAGWEVNSETVVPVVGIEASESGATMRRLELQFGPRKMLVYYWFQAGSRVANHEWVVRWYRFLDLLASEPFRPTLIVTVYVDVHDTVAKTETRAMEFLRTVGPYIEHALAPENTTQ